MNRFKKLQKGFALTETLLAIAVIVILGIAGYKMYKESRNHADIMVAINGVTELKKNIDTNFQGKTNASFAGQNFAQVLVNLGLVPQEINMAPIEGFPNFGYKEYMIDPDYGPTGTGGAAITNPRGWLMSMGSFGGTSPPLTPSQCVMLSNAFLPLFNNVTFGYAGTALKTDGVVSKTYPAQISTLCNEASQAGAGSQTLIQGSDSEITHY